MKFQLSRVVVLFLGLVLFSCSNDDETITSENKDGALKVEFDNFYGSSDLVFGTEYTNSNSEILKVNKAQYIISNIVLTKTDGTTYTVPQKSSNFIVDETEVASSVISLTNIPAGDYEKISFGVGIDKKQWGEGEAAQGNFWTLAFTAGLTWNWNPGYIFFKMEGTYTDTDTNDVKQFQTHIGQTSQSYNYNLISLDFPNATKATVSQTVTPKIKIITDLSKVLDGTNQINLSDDGSGSITGGTLAVQVAVNFQNMFHVANITN